MKTRVDEWRETEAFSSRYRQNFEVRRWTENFTVTFNFLSLSREWPLARAGTLKSCFICMIFMALTEKKKRRRKIWQLVLKVWSTQKSIFYGVSIYAPDTDTLKKKNLSTLIETLFRVTDRVTSWAVSLMPYSRPHIMKGTWGYGRLIHSWISNVLVFEVIQLLQRTVMIPTLSNLY